MVLSISPLTAAVEIVSTLGMESVLTNEESFVCKVSLSMIGFCP
jgi:hypothetical protein